MKKLYITLIHLISTTITIVTICALMMNYNGMSFNDIINPSEYKDTKEYADIVSDKIIDVFYYINLKNSFERNGELNNDITIAESLTDGVLKKWTLGDAADLAKKYDLFVDTDYKVTRQSINEYGSGQSYNFLIKTYPSSKKSGFMTEEEFAMEIMELVATYLKSRNSLDNRLTNFEYNITFSGNQNLTYNYTNVSNDNSELLDSHIFVYLSNKNNTISSNLNNIGVSLLEKCNQLNPYPSMVYTLYATIDTSYGKTDELYTGLIKYNNKMTAGKALFIIFLISSFAFFFTLAIWLISIFSSSKSQNISFKLIYALPTELYLLIYVLLTSLIIVIINIANRSNLIAADMTNIKPYLYTLAIYSTTISLFTVLSEKYASNNLTPISFQLFSKNSDEVIDTRKPKLMFAVISIPIIIFSIISAYLLYEYMIYKYISLLIIGAVLLISTIWFVIYLLYLYNSINKSILAQSQAIEMRTSLITNVSHDIKTPLTSILNYTELISSEIESPSKDSKKRLMNYSDVIIEKSNRLNTLINDLIFDSKVSSGNIEYNFVKLDLNSFIVQVISEFEEKLSEKDIVVKYTPAKEKLEIKADGNRLYRVFQNLFSNIYKYAANDTKVSIDVELITNKIIVTIKNMQQDKLEVNIKTIKDRFVQGNRSRSAGGSGLGLSIAEGLLKGMGAKLDINSIKKQFITVITFTKYEE